MHQPNERATLGLALAGAALWWAALPPLDCWPLGWVAPVPWILLVRRESLGGKRPYGSLWLAGSLFWLAAYQFIRLPHPANYVGWVALAAYLGVYLPLLVGLSRVGVHRLRLPVVLVAPTVWTGLELARAHVLTGITLGALGHTQYRWVDLIQVSDLGGAYAVDFVLVFVAACFARMLPVPPRRAVLWPLAPAAALLGAVLVYGHVRAAHHPSAEPMARIAVIQGSIDIELKMDPEKIDLIHAHYRELSEKAVRRHPKVDLVVWPETMFRDFLVSGEPGAPAPPDWQDTQEEFEAKLARASSECWWPMIDLSRSLGVPVLLGVDTVHYGAEGERRYNSAVLVAPDGPRGERYDKMHPVLFGEYMPFVDRFPWLQRFTPLPSSLTAGQRPVAFELDRLRLAPSICYENVLPHVIRNQVVTLRREGREPDVLVNLTNDGWFRGSSELDMHLACGVFRAVECRKPMLVAANTGFSAWIDPDGRIRQVGPRRDSAILFCDVGRDERASWYLATGGWFAGACLAGCLALGALGWWDRWSRSRRIGQARWSAQGLSEESATRVPSPSGRGLG